MLRGRCLIIRSRRGARHGYGIFGRTIDGDYLLAAGRVIELEDEAKALRVFHIDRMAAEKDGDLKG